MINLLGHIHKDGVSVTLNITRDRILESNITPISICLCIVLMVLWMSWEYADVMFILMLGIC